MRNYRFWQKCQTLISSHEAVLLIVASHNGSSPGKKGFKMLITHNTLVGSIGGGTMEHELVKKTRLDLSNGSFQGYTKLMKHRDTKKDSSGLVCSGEQVILVLPVTKIQISSIKDNYGSQKYLNFATDGMKIEDIANGIYSEVLDYENRVTIFGGGHVGMEVVRSILPLNFHVTLVDHRDIDSIPEGVVFIKREEYQDLESCVVNESFVVITSYGIKYDLLIVKNLFDLNLEFNYIGLMGSKSKIRRVYKEFLQLGISENFLLKMKAPIGLVISDGTPEEIAISIIAELLMTKNEQY